MKVIAQHVTVPGVDKKYNHFRDAQNKRKKKKRIKKYEEVSNTWSWNMIQRFKSRKKLLLISKCTVKHR